MEAKTISSFRPRNFLNERNTGRIFLAVFLLIGAVTENVFGEDVRIGKTSLKVSNGSSVLLKNNLSVSADALIWNDGSFYLKNKKEASLSINTILNGKGVYYFNGSAKCTIKGNGGAVSFLNVSNSSGVSISTDFSVTGTLALASGVVGVADGKSLKILNTSVDAIVFDNKMSNASFVAGNLLRNTVAGSEYLYPLGDVSTGYHPFKVSGLSASGYLGVNYLPNADDSWKPEDHNNVSLDEIGGWQVSASSEGVKFYPSLSLYSANGLLPDKYNIFYASNLNASPVEFKLNYNSILNAEGDYLTSKADYSSGFFALNKVGAKADQTEDKIPKQVNYLSKNSNVRSTFEVSGIEYYKKVFLKIYDRFGNKVYESSNYANDFDSKKFRSGTYYYELVLVTETDKKILSRNIIEIVTE